MKRVGKSGGLVGVWGHAASLFSPLFAKQIRSIYLFHKPRVMKKACDLCRTRFWLRRNGFWFWY